MGADLNVRTFDPKLVIVTFGTVIMSGYADGTFVSIEPGGPAFEMQQGADGSINRTNKNMNHYIVTVTLQQTSITNDALSVIHNADKLLNTGKLPLNVEDIGGTSVFFAGVAWIEGDPTQDDADTAGSREWKIQTGLAANVIGGNLT